jgi:hypothetical protein
VPLPERAFGLPAYEVDPLVPLQQKHRVGRQVLRRFT